MLRAGAGREMRIMFPMVAAVAEFDARQDLVVRELDHLARHDHPVPSALKLGAMVEVPSLLWELDELAERADFLSVGSNDLMQYLYAADRDNAQVSNRFDPLSAPMLRALKTIAEAGRAKNKPVTLCGELGGKPLAAIALAAIGYRHLSMAPSSIGPVKAAVLAMDLGRSTRFLDGLLEARTGAISLRAELKDFADREGIPVDHNGRG